MPSSEQEKVVAAQRQMEEMQAAQAGEPAAVIQGLQEELATAQKESQAMVPQEQLTQAEAEREALMQEKQAMEEGKRNLVGELEALSQKKAACCWP